MPNNYPLTLKIKVVKYYLFRPKSVSVKDVLNIFNIGNGSLFNWIRDYKNNCLSGGIRKHKKVKKLTSEIVTYIKRYVLERKIFRYKLLIKQIKLKFNVSISKTSIYSTLKKIGITRKRIAYRMIVKNKQIHNKLVRNFKKHINKVNQNDIISIDESHFNNQIYANYGWNIKGNKVEVKKYAKILKRYSLICAITNKKIMHYKIVEGSVNSEIFNNFITEILNNGFQNKYFLMDNARIHHAKKVKETIKNSKNELLYNVPYSPELNPIEQVFSKVKNLIKQKNDNHNPSKLKLNITKSIKNINKKHLQNFFEHSFNF